MTGFEKSCKYGLPLGQKDLLCVEIQELLCHFQYTSLLVIARSPPEKAFVSTAQFTSLPRTAAVMVYLATTAETN